MITVFAVNAVQGNGEMKMTKFELPEKPKKTNTSDDFNNLRKAVDELDKFDYAWKTYANKADRRINAANKYIEELERENQRLVAENLAVKTLVDNAKQQQALPVVPECVGNFLSGKSIFKIANGDIPDDVISWVQEQTYYVDLEKIISHLIILKVTGFTVAVEKPQLFYIEFPKVSKRDSYPWVVEIEDGIIIDFTNKKSTALKLTEQEIKSIDERYWKFAVPVEDGK